MLDRIARQKTNSANAAKTGAGWWTRSRVAQLTELATAKKTAAEIADALGDGCTRNMVIGKCARRHIALQNPSGLKIKTLSQQFWTEHRIARMRDLADLGLSIREIAADVGCRRYMVARKSHAIGLKIDGSPRACRNNKIKWLRWRIEKLTKELDALERSVAVPVAA